VSNEYGNDVLLQQQSELVMPEGANRFEETSFIQNYRNQGGNSNRELNN
jgi:hypothetical protein